MAHKTAQQLTFQESADLHGRPYVAAEPKQHRSLRPVRDDELVGGHEHHHLLILFERLDRLFRCFIQCNFVQDDHVGGLVEAVGTSKRLPLLSLTSCWRRRGRSGILLGRRPRVPLRVWFIEDPNRLRTTRYKTTEVKDRKHYQYAREELQKVDPDIDAIPTY